MRWLPVLLLVGCASEPARPGACPALDGKVFASLTQGECGLGPNGPVTCTWHLTFSPNDGTSSSYDWQHSDTEIVGAVQCAGSAVSDVGGTQRGTYDAASQQLVWDGVTYAP